MRKYVPVGLSGTDFMSYCSPLRRTCTHNEITDSYSSLLLVRDSDENNRLGRADLSRICQTK